MIAPHPAGAPARAGRFTPALARCPNCDGTDWRWKPTDLVFRCGTCGDRGAGVFQCRATEDLPGLPGSARWPLPPTAAEAELARRRGAHQAMGAAVNADCGDLAERRLGFHRHRDLSALGPFRAAMRAVLLHRVRPEHYAVPPTARAESDSSLVDLVRKHVELAGDFDRWALTPWALARIALRTGVRGWQRRDAHGFQTTGDVASVLDEVTRVLVVDAYDAAPRTFLPWCRGVELEDFKQTFVVPAGFPALDLIPEHGEYQRPSGLPLQPSEPLRLSTYGKVFALTRETVLNNDLFNFAALAEAHGAAVSEMESDAVYGLLVSNPVLGDGQALFSAAHGNLLAAGPLDVTTLAAACGALAAQTAPGRGTLHLRAAFLLVGTALGPAARQLVVPTTPATGAADAGALTVIVEPRIPGTDWYVTTSPSQCAPLVYAHLAAAPGPDTPGARRL